jgi:hypothetical protein
MATLLFLPALIRLPGQTPIQELSWPSVGKYTHIRSCLGEQGGRGNLLYARDALQQIKRALVTLPLDQLEHFCVNGADLLFEKGQMLEAEPEHSALVVAQPVTCKRPQDLRDLHTRLALGQIGDRFQIWFALEQFLPHQLSADTEDIRQYAPQLDAGFFQNLLHPVTLAAGIADQLTPPPRQVPQVADGLRRDETGPDHAVPNRFARN